jgi:two-component system, LytTR family, response regulator LytT
MKTNSYKEQIPPQQGIEGLKELSLDYGSYVERRKETGRIKRIIVYQGKRIVPVSIKDILVVFTDNNYRFIQTWEEQYSCPYTLENMEQMFEQHFFRVNRQYLISYESIDLILIEDATKLSVKMKKPFDIVMQISRRKIQLFIQWLENGGA